MKRIKTMLLILFFGFDLLFARNYTYQITTPVDIDPIPGNTVVKNGTTYHIRYYIFHFTLISSNVGSVVYVQRRVIPVSNNGLHATLIAKKTFDHKIESAYYANVSFSFCEDTHGNSCVQIPSSMIESARYNDHIKLEQKE